jgi:hypothetical protein
MTTASTYWGERPSIVRMSPLKKTVEELAKTDADKKLRKRLRYFLKWVMISYKRQTD